MNDFKDKKGLLVLLRHGKSQYNIENIFTGWLDPPIADAGIEEAHSAAKKLEGIVFNEAFTSVLQRAITTLDIVLEDTNQTHIPVTKDKALNERNYGDLQGYNKQEMAEKLGEAQVHLWRRSYDVAPPNGESLKDTAERTIPYFKTHILQKLMRGKNILISAHGNSLRSIVMNLENLNPEEVVTLNIPTGVPYIYEFDKEGKWTNKTILDKKLTPSP